MEILVIFFGLIALGSAVVAVRITRERDRLVAERDFLRARNEDLQRATARMEETFEALSAKALRASNEQFLQLATQTLDARRTAIDQLVKPIGEALERTRQQMGRVEQGHASIRTHVQAMSEANEALRRETGKLREALSSPNVRGRYGEIQLQRVVELAGMRRYCDFELQATLRDDEGNIQRPDLVVRLPNDRFIAVDAKLSFDAYKRAIDADDPDEAEQHLKVHADSVFARVQELSKKEYWAHFDVSPELVVMFVPADQLVDAALERRPELIELAAERNVVIASPSTLIGLLRAVHIGWREKSLSESAQELFELGRELHERAVVALGHAAKVGEAIGAAARHYNTFVGSVDGRLMPTLRKFEERGAKSAKTLEPLTPLEGEPRDLQSLPGPGDRLIPAAPGRKKPAPSA